MKREISCTLSGGNLIRTYSVFNDDGTLHNENVSVQGDRDTVLGQLETQVTEAKRDRDGMLNPAAAKPAPTDGAPGEDVVFWLEGSTLCETRIRRGADGKFQNQQSRPLGPRRQRLENAEERLAEITQERDAAKNAK